MNTFSLSPYVLMVARLERVTVLANMRRFFSRQLNRTIILMLGRPVFLFGLIVAKLIYKRGQPLMLLQIVIESFCTGIMTIPLVLYIFGQFLLISLFANMLVVALIPLAILLSFVAELAGMLVDNVASWLVRAAQVLLTFMLDIVNLLSRIPHVFQQYRYSSAVDMAVCYGSIVGLLGLVYWRQRWRPWHEAPLNIRNAVINHTGNT